MPIRIPPLRHKTTKERGVVEPDALTAALNWDRLMDPGDKKPQILLRSFDETRRRVDDALEAKYRETDYPSDTPVRPGEVPWILTIGPERAVVEWQGDYYALDYEIDADNNVTLGEMTPVEKAYLDPAGQPISLSATAMSAITVTMDAAADAGEADDGLIWKEVLHPGTVYKRDSGRKIEITPEIITSAYQAFQAGLPKLVSVPASHHYIAANGVVPAEENRGFVRALKLSPDQRLFAGFEFTKEETRDGVLDGSIADCSVFLQPNVAHTETGERFDWALMHVLLTNDPNMTDLGGFGEAIAAAAQDSAPVAVNYYRYEPKSEVQELETQQGHKEEEAMPEGKGNEDVLTLSGEERAQYEALAGLNMSAEEIRALADRRADLQKRTRDLEVTNIVLALEGKEEHDLVTQVEGTRHYPAVITAVEEALSAEAIALSADDDGHTEIDATLLGVINALPKEARLALSADAGPQGNKNPQPPQGNEHEETEVSDEQADAFLENIGA